MIVDGFGEVANDLDPLVIQSLSRADALKNSEAGIFKEVLAQSQALLHIPFRDLGNLLALVAYDILQLRLHLVVLDDVVERERVAPIHNLLVDNKALMQVHHLLVHLELLQEVERDRDES